MMINHNTTYEAGTPELASGFLLMPCYASALGFCGWLVPFFLFIFFVRGQSFNHSFSLLLITEKTRLKIIYNYLKTKIHIFKNSTIVNNFIWWCRNFIVSLSYN